MSKIPLNPFLSPHPGDSLNLIAQGLKLVTTVLATAGDGETMLTDEDFSGLSHVTNALGAAIRYEGERYPELRAGQDGPISIWNAAVDE